MGYAEIFIANDIKSLTKGVAEIKTKPLTIFLPIANNDTFIKANEVAIPISFSKKLTFPERVCSFNFNCLDTLVKENKVNYVIRDNGSKIYDINIYKKPKIFYKKKGFMLEKGDIIIRNNN